MNWDALGATAELLGALGVIITLGYLARQMRQASAVTGASNYWQLTSQMSDFMNLLATDAELMEIYQRGIVSYLGLSELDRARFHMLISGLVNKYQVMYQLRDRGQLDADLYEDMFSGVLELLSVSGVQEWWREQGHWFAESFRRFVDAHLERIDP